MLSVEENLVLGRLTHFVGSSQDYFPQFCVWTICLGAGEANLAPIFVVFFMLSSFDIVEPVGCILGI